MIVVMLVCGFHFYTVASRKLFSKIVAFKDVLTSKNSEHTL